MPCEAAVGGPKHGSYGMSVQLSRGDAGEHANVLAMVVREHDTHSVNGWRNSLGIELAQREHLVFIQQLLEG